MDGAIRRIQYAYDSQGNQYLTTSYDAATGGAIVNQVQQVYNGVASTYSWPFFPPKSFPEFASPSKREIAARHIRAAVESVAWLLYWNLSLTTPGREPNVLPRWLDE